MKPTPEVKFISAQRETFASIFPNNDFDACSWGIRHLRKSETVNGAVRVYFTKYGSTTEPLPLAFAQMVKAFLLTPGISGSSMPARANAARMLWMAIEKRLGSNSEDFRWADVREEDALEAEQQMLLHWRARSTYSQCAYLRYMLAVLADAPFGAIVRPMSVTFQTPNPGDNLSTFEGQERQMAKLPPDGSLIALGKLFFTGVANVHDQLILCVFVILLLGAFRIGEVLTLPLDCWVTEGEGEKQRHGIRFYKEKSRKRLQIRWLKSEHAALAKTAIDRATLLTDSARARARELEQAPNTFPISGVGTTSRLGTKDIAVILGLKIDSVRRLIRKQKLANREDRKTRDVYVLGRDLMSYLHSIRGPLHVIARGDGTFEMLSESLFTRFSPGHLKLGARPLFVSVLSYRSVDHFLGGQTKGGETKIKSVFERYNLRDDEGKLFTLNSHNPRHWVTTKLAKVGAANHLIALWEAREGMAHLDSYMHLTPEERLVTLKSALKEKRLTGAFADFYYSLKDDVRDAFLEGQLQAVHVTPLGLCVHDFKAAPCPKFINCVKRCEDYVLDTSNKDHISNLVQLEVRTKQTLDQALEQCAKGEEDLSENWVEEAKETLDGVREILDEVSKANADGEKLQPFKNQGSKFKKLK